MSRLRSALAALQTGFAAVVLPLALVAAYFIYYQLLGNPANFVGGDPANEPLPNNYLGVVYKGGPIVILLLSFQLILLTFIFERFISLGAATGRSNNKQFVQRFKALIQRAAYSEAISSCDQQRGTVANVIRSGLDSFQRVWQDDFYDKEEKIQQVQREVEECTQLELPQLNRNLVIISTLASVSTLVGLLGTVTGMIVAFSALARVGAPDAVGLAGGISQALVTTALGISTAALAIVFYNYFTTRIDKITYAIDEATFSMLHHFKDRIASSNAVVNTHQTKAPIANS